MHWRSNLAILLVTVLIEPATAVASRTQFMPGRLHSFSTILSK